ncbi:MAG: glutathione S-transferase [Gammaproteobacteria bacterium]|nr:glutathione S-transferase [Gammaproteobacteria bacterium]
MKLYDFELSGNCYKIRLILSLLGLSYERQTVDLANGEQTGEAFLKLNSKGEVPVLQDGEQCFSDSNAILVYLATKYAPEHYLPQDPETLALIQYWLSTAANEIHHGVAAARVVKLFGLPRDYDNAIIIGTNLLLQLDEFLSTHQWLATDKITIADIAIYPYVALAEDGGISVESYSHIQQWFKRIESLPGYTPLPTVAVTA